MDLTLREIQTELKRARAPWALAKGFDGSAPVGAFVPARNVADAGDLVMELTVSGETRQKGRTSSMIFPPEELLRYASRYFTLESGDLLFTGTPAGVGPLVDGDTVLARIDGLPDLGFTVKRP